MLKIINILFIIILMITIFFISFLESRISNKNKKKILFIFVFIISIFLAFRDIGLDLEPYRNTFNNQKIISLKELFKEKIFSTQLEPFFIILISFLKKYGLNYNWFLFISGSIPIFIIYKIIIKNEKKYPIFTFFLFMLILFFRGPVDIIRHFFAASIYLSAIWSLSNENKTLYWIKSIFSIFFHYSNIIILFIKPFLNIKWNKIKFFISIFITFFIGIFSKILLININNFNFWNTDNVILWKFGYYLTYSDSVGYNYLGIPHKVLLSIIQYFPLVFSFIITIMALNKIEIIKNSKFLYLLLNSQILGILIAIFFIIIDAPTLGMRLHFLLNIGSFFIVKEILLKNNIKNTLLYGFTILSLVFYNFLIILYNAGIHNPASPFYLF